MLSQRKVGDLLKCMNNLFFAVSATDYNQILPCLKSNYFFWYLTALLPDQTEQRDIL